MQRMNKSKHCIISMEDVHNLVRKSIFSVKLTVFGPGVLLLPIVGFFICVLLSVVYNFESSTATHCKVANYLPSISAAIGGFTPQRYIWRMCIALHCGPRLFALIAYYNTFRQQNVNRYQRLYYHIVKLTSCLHLVENFCLLLLTCVSSTENYSVHEMSFIIFLACSEFYMLLTCILFYWSQCSPSQFTSTKNLKSLKLKVLCFGMNLFSCGLAAYFFYRHNKYCEPGVYSLFALSEYFVVMTNIAFHATAVMDFSNGYITYVETPKSSYHTE